MRACIQEKALTDSYDPQASRLPFTRAIAVALASLALGWGWMILVTTRLPWDSRWHWLPVACFALAAAAAAIGWDDEDRRPASVLLGLGSIGSVMLYVVEYVFFVFAFGGQ